MIKTISKIGNSQGLIFDAALMELAHLRAGEDLVLMAALQARYGAREICQLARVSYTHFPTSWRQAWRKWRVTELHCVLAGVRTGQQALYLLGLPALYVLAGVGGSVGAAVFVGVWVGVFVAVGALVGVSVAPPVCSIEIWTWSTDGGLAVEPEELYATTTTPKSESLMFV